MVYRFNDYFLMPCEYVYELNFKDFICDNIENINTLNFDKIINSFNKLYNYIPKNIKINSISLKTLFKNLYFNKNLLIIQFKHNNINIQNLKIYSNGYKFSLSHDTNYDITIILLGLCDYDVKKMILNLNYIPLNIYYDRLFKFIYDLYGDEYIIYENIINSVKNKNAKKEIITNINNNNFFNNKCKVGMKYQKLVTIYLNHKHLYTKYIQLEFLHDLIITDKQSHILYDIDIINKQNVFQNIIKMILIHNNNDFNCEIKYLKKIGYSGISKHTYNRNTRKIIEKIKNDIQKTKKINDKLYINKFKKSLIYILVLENIGDKEIYEKELKTFDINIIFMNAKNLENTYSEYIDEFDRQIETGKCDILFTKKCEPSLIELNENTNWYKKFNNRALINENCSVEIENIDFKNVELHFNNEIISLKTDIKTNEYEDDEYSCNINFNEIINI